jgi:dTDP-4-dehydrorhamnose reductase
MDSEVVNNDAVLVTGAAGYVGRRLLNRLGDDFDVVGLSRSGPSDLLCDLTDTAALRALAADFTPGAIVHAAGNKNIAGCERSPELAYEANVTTLLNLLRVWPDVPVLYISTDYVFDGSHGQYSEASATAPGTVYGLSKLCAEGSGRLLGPRTFTSVRVSALYDASATFLSFLSKELTAGRPVECFSDAFYSPTYFEDFADAILRLLVAPDRPPVVHVAGPRVSRYAFARQYAAAFGFDADLIRSAERGAGSTLFPDLSLATAVAHVRLNFVATNHDAALNQIAAGGPLDDSRTVPPILRFPRPDARSHQRRQVGGDQLRGDRGRLRARRSLSSKHA